MGCSSDKNSKTIDNKKHFNTQNTITSQNISQVLTQNNKNAENEEDILIYNDLLVSENKEEIMKYYIPLETIGQGSYGKVLLVEKNDDKKVYAMKILKKKAMIKRNQVTHIKTERKIMELIDHPFVVKLRYAFQTPQKLYFIMDYCPGGELFFHIQKVERFNEDAVKFYGAQIALALDHLHKNNIIYRE